MSRFHRTRQSCEARKKHGITLWRQRRRLLRVGPTQPSSPHTFVVLVSSCPKRALLEPPQTRSSSRAVGFFPFGNYILCDSYLRGCVNDAVVTPWTKFGGAGFWRRTSSTAQSRYCSIGPHSRVGLCSEQDMWRLSQRGCMVPGRSFRSRCAGRAANTED